mmetsp:Transcript_7269/g.16469  ORF Transcript_7269/g.16469 Transcript_7269/m.16469 type:complete len:239 (+) Transcript_7269:1051-1767(+)
MRAAVVRQPPRPDQVVPDVLQLFRDGLVQLLGCGQPVPLGHLLRHLGVYGLLDSLLDGLLNLPVVELVLDGRVRPVVAECLIELLVVQGLFSVALAVIGTLALLAHGLVVDGFERLLGNHALQRAVARRHLGDVDVGLPLTGGVGGVVQARPAAQHRVAHGRHGLCGSVGLREVVVSGSRKVRGEGPWGGIDGSLLRASGIAGNGVCDVQVESGTHYEALVGELCGVRSRRLYWVHTG